VMTTVSKSLTPTGVAPRHRKDVQTAGTVRAMQAIMHDLQILSEALDDNVEMFAHDHRNFGAQQVCVWWFF